MNLNSYVLGAASRRWTKSFDLVLSAVNIEIVNLVLGYYIRISVIVTFDFEALIEALMLRYDMDTAEARHGYGKDEDFTYKNELLDMI